MNQSKINYQNALANLGNSHFALPQAPIIEETGAEKLREVGKSITTDFGNILLSNVATSGINKLSKMGNQLSKLGIESQDAKSLTEAIENSDSRTIGKLITKLGTKKIKLGIRKLTGKTLKDDELPDPVEEQISRNERETGNPIQTEDSPVRVPEDASQGEQYEMQSFREAFGNNDSPQRDPDFTNDQFERDPEGDDTDFFAQMGGRAPPRNLSDDQFYDAPEALQETQIGDVAPEATTATTTASDVATATSSGLEDATLLSTATDDTGVGLLLTAGLGIASLFTGLFLKSKKPKVIQPPPIQANNFAVQAGIN